ncbi:MAG: histidine phosphatase family protein [Rhodoluna sp.]|nr:histidine phosphatase family protein [Rhodoluna sp.]
MPANRIHLVRHGEVYNPNRVLYEQLPNFHLSDKGKLMALAAAQELKSLKAPVKALFSSPLDRAQESAAPFEELFNLEIQTDQRLIEPTNAFKGKKMGVKNLALKPHLWWYFRNPARPSWGEPYKSIIARMKEAMVAAAESVSGGDVVLVTHQLPIWITHLVLQNEKLQHDPRKRRCSLSSITTFEYVEGKFVELTYLEPAKNLTAIDSGAV